MREQLRNLRKIRRISVRRFAQPADTGRWNGSKLSHPLTRGVSPSYTLTACIRMRHQNLTVVRRFSAGGQIKLSKLRRFSLHCRRDIPKHAYARKAAVNFYAPIVPKGPSTRPQTLQILLWLQQRAAFLSAAQLMPPFYCVAAYAGPCCRDQV